MSDTISALKLDENRIVDTETGEEIEWPESIQDVPARLSFLTSKKRECTEQENAWKSRGGFLGQVALGLLNGQAMNSWTDPEVGKLGVQSRTYKTVDMEKLPTIVGLLELSETQVNALILYAVKELDADKVREGCEVLGLPEVLAESLISESTSTWVTARAAPKYAKPKVGAPE